MTLEEIIIGKIKASGPLPFHDLMEMALYYPRLGYYHSSRERIGKSGDFFTSPYLTSLFGDMIAKQLEEMWMLTGGADFAIVEYGAGTGVLCRDILRALRSNKMLYDRLDYYIIEKSGAMKEKERATLSEEPGDLLEKITWVENIGEVPPVTGCILSNELIDNFAVHRVMMQNELMEVFVDHDKEFIESLRPATQELVSYFSELKVSLPRGYRTEVNLEAKSWIKEVSRALDKGFVMTIDYGYSSSGLYRERFNTGTLVCYHRHKVNYCPYHNIGEQDITTHVNFSALDHWGRADGLETCGFTNQSHFLRALGLACHIQRMEQRPGYTRVSEPEKSLLLKTLLMDMGSRFKLLIQQKGLHRPYLSGLRFPEPLE